MNKLFFFIMLLILKNMSKRKQHKIPIINDPSRLSTQLIL